MYEYLGETSVLFIPNEFKNRMKEYLGDEYDAFIASYDKAEVKGLRINTKAPGDILGALCDEKSEISAELFFTRIPWIDNGYSYIQSDDGNTLDANTDETLATDSRLCKISLRPGKHPYHEAGAYYIQEPSAMSPAIYLDAEPGDRVLDLCAAPGGKSTQIADMLKGEGILVANEIMPDRARILSENIERMGVKNALVISEDPRNISGRFAGFFDKILVDAPCSGEGMFRRSQTAVEEWTLDNVLMCADRQEWILDEASLMLRPGGRLVYSTCTFSKEENENTIAAFLKRHEDFELEEMMLFGEMRRGFDNIGIRLWPHHVDGEGHFVCALRRKSYSEVDCDNADTNIISDANIFKEDTDADKRNSLEAVKKVMPPCGYERGINKKDPALKEMYSFIENNIVDRDFGKDRVLVRFKDQIYMLPKECPSLSGLKVIRPGLHLGELKKNRFEPAHALAKALHVGDVNGACQLTKDSPEIYKYINGETFNISLPNGWHVIFIDGMPIGWGKVANEIMKNHYPKGLRKKLD